MSKNASESSLLSMKAAEEAKMKRKAEEEELKRKE